MTHRFASIAQPGKIGYMYDPTSYSGGFISSHMKFYETYGDGLTMHSPGAPISLGMFADYLFSLAAAMQDNVELIQACAYEFRAGRVSNPEVAFALSVTYKEGKTRYYSRDERKVSSSPAKRHDKRYQEITSRHDGSFDSAYNILWRDHFDGIHCYALVESILRYGREVEDCYWGIAADKLRWDVDRDRLSRAWEVCVAAIQAYENAQNAARGIAYYRKQIDELHNPPVEPAAQEVA